MTAQAVYRLIVAVVLAAALAHWTAEAFAADDASAAGQAAAPHTRNWAVIAVRTDRDAAIGIARSYLGRHPRVVKRPDGAFEVVLGPTAVATMDEFRAAYRDARPDEGDLDGIWSFSQLPSDTRLSFTEDSFETIWSPRSVTLARGTFNDGKTAKLSIAAPSGAGFTVSVRTESASEAGKWTIHISGSEGLDLRTPPREPAARAGHIAKLIWLDRSAPYPQIIIQLSSLSKDQDILQAGIFTQTWIATKAPSGWILIDCGATDDWIEFTDVDDDGNVELLRPDQDIGAMFYEGARRNGIGRLERLVGNHLVYLSQEAIGRSDNKQAIAAMEYEADLKPDRWHADGFLAIWVTRQARAGRFAAAWSKMLDRYDPNGERTDANCAGFTDPFACPLVLQHQLLFPQTLAIFLRATGADIPADLPSVPPSSSTGAILDAARGDSLGNSASPKAAIHGAAYTGSAVLIAPRIFVTASHIVAGCTDVAVRLGDTLGSGRVLAYNEIDDLALIETRLASATVAPLRFDVRLGEPVATFGFDSGGISPTDRAALGRFASGNIAAATGIADDPRFLQVSIPARSDATGTAVLDEHGNLVAIVDGATNALATEASANSASERPSFAMRLRPVLSLAEAAQVPQLAALGGPPLSDVELEEKARNVTGRVLCQM